MARQVGDAHPSKPWVWTEYKPGKFDWRPAKKGAAVKQDGGLKSGDEDVTGKSAPVPGKPSSAAITAAKVKAGNGMSPQQLAQWAMTAKEAALVTVVNGPRNNATLRHTAFNELKNRGYDVSSLNTSGTLDDLRKLTSSGQQTTNSGVAADSGANVKVDGVQQGGGEITERWYLNRNDPRVKNKFNLNTKDGRIKYDAFVDEMKRKEPDYRPPQKVIQGLNTQYLEFLGNDAQRFMISAGGAGIGKSYGFNKLAEILNKKPFDPATDQPGDGDYDIFEANDVASKKQLLQILKNHNGKVIVFDDTDAVLTRADIASIMKKATSATGKRIVGDPDDIKSNFEFTGRIVIMTNKDLATLSQNEDTKAIISRAMLVSEIYMTIPETIEVLEQRYQQSEFDGAPRLDDANEDKKERDEILKVIKDNIGNIDPSAFTTRTFQEILINKRAVDSANEQRKNPLIADLIGDQEEDWKVQAAATLTKAVDFDVDDYFEKGEEPSEEVLKAEDLLFEKGGNKHDFSEEERKKLAKNGEAMKDGSYPIRNEQDLKDAIQAIGRAKNPASTKSHIKKRAEALGKTSLLPEDWKEKAEDDMTLIKAEVILGLADEDELVKAEISNALTETEIAESILGI